ncbi:MAG: tetratricopeptide repeat protein, partial [Candidatus Poribacteria bacterium]|nr:tetratricopeptide repeat protein [Candidatus Poribacteria bacterium]
ACYDKVIEIDPNDDLPVVRGAWNVKGNALQKLERYDDAIACYDKVIEIDPNDDLPVVRGAWNRKGDALQELERYDDAIACYDKAKNVYAWNSKGDALQKLEMYDDAIASYDKVIGTAKKRKSDRNSNTIGLAYRSKGTVLQKLERYDDALACYDKVIEMFPGDIMTWDNQRIVLEKLESEYDPRCAHCDHYPWTDVFVSGRGWDEHQARFGLGSSTFNERYKCECKCHDAPTYGKIMRFSLKGKNAETSRFVMHAFKLAVCPFCKRSEFEDSVFNKINDRANNHYYGPRGFRHEMLAEDLKATGAPEREREFDYNDLFEPGEHNINETLLTPCAGNHKHEWYKCACGRNVCKISFRNYFG